MVDINSKKIVGFQGVPIVIFWANIGPKLNLMCLKIITQSVNLSL